MDELIEKLLSVDTLLNLWVFVFIGLMIWLYFKSDENDDSKKGSG